MNGNLIFDISQPEAIPHLRPEPLQMEGFGILESKAVGRTIVYNIEHNSPLVKSFRIFENLLELNELVESLKQHCRRIILFGSCSRGEDMHDSDIDLFIVADKEFAEIKPVISDALELIQMEKNDKVFLQEVNKGLRAYGVQKISIKVSGEEED